MQYKESAILMNRIEVAPREGAIEANKTLVRKKGKTRVTESSDCGEAL